MHTHVKTTKLGKDWPNKPVFTINLHKELVNTFKLLEGLKLLFLDGKCEWINLAASLKLLQSYNFFFCLNVKFWYFFLKMSIFLDAWASQVFIMSVKQSVSHSVSGIREAFRCNKRWELGHCTNWPGSLPTLPKLERISENS